MFILPELIPDWVRRWWSPVPPPQNDPMPGLEPVEADAQPAPTPAENSSSSCFSSCCSGDSSSSSSSPPPQRRVQRGKGGLADPKVKRALARHPNSFDKILTFYDSSQISIGKKPSELQYDQLVRKMRELIKQHNLTPLLQGAKREFATLREMTVYLASWGPERVIASLFPVYVVNRQECPVLFRGFQPIVVGITAMLPRDTVRCNFTTYKGRKKIRLVFRSKKIQTLWYAQLFDLIQTASDIALASSAEEPPEDVSEQQSSSQGEASNNVPGTPVIEDSDVSPVPEKQPASEVV